MKYQSSRGGSKGLSFEDVLFSGYAPDGGLFVPSSIPKLDLETLKSWSGGSYSEIAKRFLPLFIGEDEIPKADLELLVDEAFGVETKKFDVDEIAPSKVCEGFDVLELFHGPTLAFKDLSLTLVGRLVDYFLKKNSRHVTILVGTSGDTGSAVIEAVRGSNMVDMVVLLPKGRCTKIQELQMTSVLDDNVHVYRVDGTSDDLDVPIKRCFDDAQFVNKHNIISLNSINWARVLIQAVHFVFAFLKYNPAVDADKTVEFFVPTGACGNVTGGCLAVCMGVPMKFVTAVTVNDIVSRAVFHSDFSMAPEVTPTLAPSIDIQVPYNMERIYFFCSDGDERRVAAIMKAFEDSGSSALPAEIHERISGFVSARRVEDAGIVEALKRIKREEDYVVCPHTAVAVAAYYDRKDAATAASAATSTSSVIIATASPAKFPEALEIAGLDKVFHPRIEKLWQMKTKFVDMEKGEDWTDILKKKVEAITAEKLLV